MQEDAINRVLEMQRQSREITEEKKEEPEEYLDEKEVIVTKKEEAKPKVKPPLNPRNVNNQKSDLSDETLLIALLILLINEKTETALILAIIYILL